MRNPFYIMMAIFALVGVSVNIYNEAVGSFLMGIAAGIGILLIHPILRELVELAQYDQ